MKQSKHLLILWKHNPNCVNCGCTTRYGVRLGKGKVPDDVATIQHLYPKNHPVREYCRCVVLFCRKCNVEDNREMSRKLNKIENNKILQMLQSEDDELKVLGFTILCERGIGELKGFFLKNGELYSMDMTDGWTPVGGYRIPLLVIIPQRWKPIYNKKTNIFLIYTSVYMYLMG